MATAGSGKRTSSTRDIYYFFVKRAVNGESCILYEWSEKCTCTHALTLCLAPFVAKRKLPFFKPGSATVYMHVSG